MTKDDFLNMRRNLIGALKMVEKFLEKENDNMAFNKGKEITKKEQALAKYEAAGRPRVIWDSRAGTYIKNKHGEIGSKKVLTNK